jgi:hypothetical protein
MRFVAVRSLFTARRQHSRWPLNDLTATVRRGPLDGAPVIIVSPFRAIFNQRPSTRHQFLIQGKNELHGFEIGANAHCHLIEVAPRPNRDLVESVLPLHVTAVALEVKDPSSRHAYSRRRERGHSPRSAVLFARESCDIMA